MNDALQSIHARCVEVGECWEWQGWMSTHGQPQMKLPRALPSKPGTLTRNYAVTMLVWEAHHGAFLKPGWVVWRTCRNERCLAPEHLRAGTRAQMLQAMKRAGAFARSQDAIAAITNAARRRVGTKLSIQDAREIRAMHGEVPAGELAARYGVESAHIHRIWRLQAWREAVPAASVFSWGG